MRRRPAAWALIYACSENREKPVINADAAEWACGLSEHLTRRVLYLAHEYVSQGEFDAKQRPSSARCGRRADA